MTFIMLLLMSAHEAQVNGSFPWPSLFWTSVSSLGIGLAIRNILFTLHGLSTARRRDSKLPSGVLNSTDMRVRVLAGVIWMYLIFIIAGVVGLTRPTPSLPSDIQGWITLFLFMSLPFALIYITSVIDIARVKSVTESQNHEA